MHLKDLQSGLQRIVFDGFDEISLKLMQRFVGAMEKSEVPPLFQQDHGKKSDEVELKKTERKVLGKQCDTVYGWGFFGSMSNPKVIEIMTTDEHREASSEERVCGQCEIGDCKCRCVTCGKSHYVCHCEVLRERWEADW